jgi:hypothetical protein
VGVKVGKPSAAVGVNVAVIRSPGPLVAVAGVVVRLGTGVSVLATVVGEADASATGGVGVSEAGAVVGEGRAVSVMATAVLAMESTVPAISTVGADEVTTGAGKQAPSKNAQISVRTVNLFIMYSL